MIKRALFALERTIMVIRHTAKRISCLAIGNGKSTCHQCARNESPIIAGMV
jgi:hypothetical protein